MKTIIAIVLLLSVSAHAEDALAEGLVAAGRVHLAKGQYEAAKGVFYKALIYDERCGAAYFELARMAERRGDKVEATTLYERAAAVGDEKQKQECAARLKIINPYKTEINDALKDYATGLERIARRGTMAESLAQEKATAMKLPPVRIAREEPVQLVNLKVASVSFHEDMGYAVADLKPGVSSHVTESFIFSKVPKELVGLKYTRLVAYRVSAIDVRFDTTGILYILVNKSWDGYGREAAKLAALGAFMSSVESLNSGKAEYEVWELRRNAGDIVELSNHILVAASLTKTAFK